VAYYVFFSTVEELGSVKNVTATIGKISGLYSVFQGLGLGHKGLK
jgi:hypothetical protein